MDDHDGKHVEVRLAVPWRPDMGPVRVEVVHRCEKWGCPQRLIDWTEQATYPEEVLRKVLVPRGMMSGEKVPLSSPTTAWLVDLYGEVPPTATHVVLPVAALEMVRDEKAKYLLKSLRANGVLPQDGGA